MIEAKVCKITRGLAHEDCPDDCQTKERKELPLNRISKKYKLKMPIDNLYVHWVMESGFKSRDGKYDVERALDKCKFISKKFSIAANPEDSGNPFAEDPYSESDYEKIDISERHNIMELRKCINRINGYKKEGAFVFPIEPKPVSVIEAYLPSKEFFGSDIKSKNLNTKIKNLIASGVNKNNKILGKLRKDHHLKKNKDENLDIVNSQWDWIEKDKKFIKQTRELDRLFSEQQPLKGRKTIKRPKPFDEFSISLVLAAKEKEIITGEEAGILKYRYGLEDQEVKSLRLIAGWLGISHTNVRNIEIKALKKMKEHIGEIKKSTPIKEPMGRDITEEEYKRRFGHDPDLGKK